MRTTSTRPNCKLPVLHRDDFDDMIRNPLIETRHPNVAKTMVEAGYQLLDVRYAEKFDNQHILGAKSCRGMNCAIGRMNWTRINGILCCSVMLAGAAR
jgi:hypothetical protein